MKGKKVKTLIVLVVFCLMGCVTKEDQQKLTPDNKKLTICPEPRPEVCTMDYRPVCAQRQDGSFKTYSNWCNSCTDPNVFGYQKGECESARTSK